MLTTTWIILTKSEWLEKAQVSNPLAAICNNDDYNRSTRLLAATTLRNVLGTKVTPPHPVLRKISEGKFFQNLGEILSEREAIAEAMHHR